MTILESLQTCKRTLGILIDPEKLDADGFSAFAKAIQTTMISLTEKLQLDQVLFLIGGSTLESVDLDRWLTHFRKTTGLKLLLFPGSHRQISENADGLLFLNLISGRNPDYLIGEQVAAAGKLKNTNLEIIPTAYLLIDGGMETAVSRVSQTIPMSQNDPELIYNTAIAGQLMGNKLIYLEAGSGASYPVGLDIIREVARNSSIPIIVGGGLRKHGEINARFDAGVSMVVVGTIIEEDVHWIG